MKKFVKILTLCAVMIFAMSFSVFSATKTEKASSLKLKDGTVVKVEKDFNGKVKSIQFPNEKKVELKNFQLMMSNAAKVDCSKMVNTTLATKCQQAIAAVIVTGGLATLVCLTQDSISCSAAVLAGIQATKKMYDECQEGYYSYMKNSSIKEIFQAEATKLAVKEKTNFSFKYGS